MPVRRDESTNTRHTNATLGARPCPRAGNYGVHALGGEKTRITAAYDFLF